MMVRSIVFTTIIAFLLWIAFIFLLPVLDPTLVAQHSTSTGGVMPIVIPMF